MTEEEKTLTRKYGCYKATEIFKFTQINNNLYSRFINQFLKNNPYAEKDKDWGCMGPAQPENIRGRKRYDYWISESLCLSICKYIINAKKYSSNTKLECRKLQKKLIDLQQHG